jgi:hypothetical protein
VDALANSAQAMQRLNGILERLGGALKAKEARVELIVGEQVVTVAKIAAGKVSQLEDLLATPRLDSLSPVSKSFAAARERKASMAAHAILAPAETSLIVGDVLLDWRFKHLEIARSMRFYAGIGVQDHYGHAVATISLYDTAPRQDGLTLGQEKLLVMAAKDAATELLSARRSAMHLRLAKLDESIRTWAYCPPSSQASPTALSAPRMFQAPSSPGRSIAERRKAKAPAELVVPSPSEGSHPEHRRLQRAVDAISECLCIDNVYIASINSEPLETSAIAISRCARASLSCLDAPLHLCTLATGKQGLHLQGDRAAQLTGNMNCQSAYAIRCTTEEQDRSGKCTDGWVLGLIATNTIDFQAHEITLYLQRFASLLGAVLHADGKPKTPAKLSPRTTRPMRSPMRAVHAGNGLVKKNSSVRVLPAASPPPAGPLPLPPLTASRKANMQNDGSDSRLPPGHILNTSSHAAGFSKPLSPPPSAPLPLPQMRMGRVGNENARSNTLRSSRSFGAVGGSQQHKKWSSVTTIPRTESDAELEKVLHLDQTEGF